MKEKENKNIGFLWQSFLNGDDKIFLLIYQKYIDRLLSYGYKLCKDRDLVHDSIQEIFITLFIKRKKAGKNIENIKSYLFIAFRNNITKKIQKQKKHEPLKRYEDNESQYFNTEYNIQNQLIDFEISNEIKRRLSEAVNSLPSKQKEIIYLKFEEELEYFEISAIMGISIESSRKLMYRALLTLRKIIDPKTVQLLFILLHKKN